ncbi:RNA polymerase sigma factor FliA [Andreprevotia sp. IGB-42]|uniref:sigma-70 family RNA polymerase sigma factor n=1 Tax=Andreprevotia sp. IGB-42 TaxID=2497473 RepID=UPI00135A09D5|nr:sigma-70 family RNA polymerase sigma factor [Andreprevotia sp. IGB-42]KAF0813386.1 RNA polymerase sigma factor FliA [Andreprevotia sp. IGB-42]
MPTKNPLAWKAIAPERETALWQARDQADGIARQQLATLYLPFAKMMAAQIYAKRINNEIEFNEYLQLASLGLLDAIDRFKVDAGAQFTTYAEYRIVGTIRNELEGYTEHRRQIAVQKRIRERIYSLNADGAAVEGEALERLARIAIGMAMGMLLEDERLCASDDEAAAPVLAYSSRELAQLRQCLMQLLENLPENERAVIRYHYLQQLEFTDIAALMSLSKGRISQLHRSALEHLRESVARLKTSDLAW